MVGFSIPAQECTPCYSLALQTLEERMCTALAKLICNVATESLIDTSVPTPITSKSLNSDLIIGTEGHAMKYMTLTMTAIS